MTIRLAAPGCMPGGPDGRGWNRLSLNAHVGEPAAQCALRPTSWSTLVESRRGSRLARWGLYGRCTRSDGDCGACPLLAAAPRELRAFTDRVLVRLLERRGRGLGAQVWMEPHLMNRPEQGWASSAVRWTWEELFRLQGWKVGDRHLDEHSDGFWLIRTN